MKFLGINWGDLKLRVHVYTVTHLGISCTVVVLTGFKMCVCVCVGVLIICVLVFTVFCIVCTVFCIVSFMYIYSYLFCLY